MFLNQHVDWLVPHNTNKNAWLILSRVLGIDHDRVWHPSLAEVGHVTSADVAINLASLMSSGKLQPGQRALLVSAGFGLNWQAAVVQAGEELR